MSTIPNALDKTASPVDVGTSPVVLSEVAGARALRLAYAARWALWITATGGDLTLVRYRSRGRPDWPWGPWVTATGVTPADGETGLIERDGVVGDELDVELTGSAAMTASLHLAGV